jgi:outer membrane protein assembly factor BamB
MDRAVLIIVRCPKCDSKYHLDPGLLGKRTRCPNPVCKAIFEVKAEDENGETKPAEAGNSIGPVANPVVEHRSGSVGDLVPLLPAEAADEPESSESQVQTPLTPAEHLDEAITSNPLPPVPLLPAELAESPEERSWSEAPPVRRTPAAQPPLPKPPPAAPPPAPANRATPKPFVRPKPPAPAKPAWESAPPPVRRGGVPQDTSERESASPQTEAVADERVEDVAATTPRSRARWIIAALLFMMVGIGGAVGYSIWSANANSEEARYQKARDLYGAGRYADAADAFGNLEADFPESVLSDTYRFMNDWSRVRANVHRTDTDPADGLNELNHFVEGHAREPYFEPIKPDVGESYARLLEDIAGKLERGLDAQSVDLLETAVQSATKYARSSQLRAYRDQITVARAKLDQQQKRQHVLGFYDELLKRPSKDILVLEDELLKPMRRELPNIDQDAEVQKRHTEVLKARAGLVTWTAKEMLLERPSETSEPSLWIAASTLPPAAAARPAAVAGRVVFALARGVLYALDQDTGAVRWVTRVGIDTTTLPVRLSATATWPEIVLVLSSDPNTLTARDARSGQALWRMALTAPCLGRPLIVDAKAYVPTYDGLVYELDILAGKQLGWFDLGAPLSLGGVRQEGTSFLYFPADERMVFVVDLAKRDQPCATILLSGHPAGSLRSEPVIVSRAALRKDNRLDEAAWPDYLILNQSTGLDSTTVRIFTLPIRPDAPRFPEPQVPGWSWFPPSLSHERLVQVTDEGVLGLIGIKQPGNQDRDLFLEMKYQLPTEKEDARAGRAQVAHATDDDIWVLARGQLRLLHYDRFRQTMVPIWTRPLSLGSPVHASQVEGNVLVLVTQAAEESVCRATAINLDDSASQPSIRWQTQLGLLPTGEPIALGDKLVVLDQGGNLFQFDPKEAAEPGWHGGGERVGSMPAFGTGRLYPVVEKDGRSMNILALDTDSRLSVRSYEPGKKISTRMFGKHPAPAGAPIQTESGLVVALADGRLLHLPKQNTKEREGPEWRARHADRDTHCYLTALDGDDFLVTDGSRGLARWHWTGGNDFEKKTATEDLPGRITAAPLLVPGNQLQVCIADARGTLTLLAEEGKSWKTVRSWKLGGRITAGPFLRGSLVGCVIDRQRLVFVDPAKRGIVWQYGEPDAAIVGIPQSLDGKLIVAHQTGWFVALDPATGKRIGAGHRLGVHVAPATTAVPFGKDRLFVPLTDGTVMLLTQKQLRMTE